jgi:Oxygenase domain of the 2OGFeDO superfamily
MDGPFKPEIYEGLQTPKKVREVRERVRVVTVEPKMSGDEIKAKEGAYFTDQDVDTVFDEDVDVYGIDEAGEKKLLARFRKQVLPIDLIKQGWEAYYQTAAASRNRGAAAGPINLKSHYWMKRKPVEIQGWSARYKQDGKTSKMRVNNNVYSSVLGYFERTPFMGLPCRLTSYTQKYFKQYRHGIPFIEAIDATFQKLIPDKHAKQKAAAAAAPAYQIEDTAFSSITINRNFRTAMHMDDGDFREGYGNLSVIERGRYSGGATIFPRYRIGFNVRTGDFLAMDVHEWHCNTEMTESAADKAYNKALPKIHYSDVKTGTMGSDKDYTRISFVCYLREKMRGCKVKDTRSYYKRIAFDPVRGPLKTRKVKRSA